MKFVIIASEKDPAGMNIVKNLKKLNCNVPIHLIKEELIHAENIDKEINKKLNADFLIFASRHKANDTKKTLTVHTIGNFHKADYGGKDKTLVYSNAKVFKHFFQNLNNTNKNSNSNYLVTMESTHHGPYIEKPCLFIEIGPSETEWRDKNAGKIIAKTIIESINTIQNIKEKDYKITIGLGGPHYCPNFNEIQLEEKYAISFIASSYNFPLNKENITELIKKTKEKVECFLIDWKSFKSEERSKLLELLKESNLEIIKTTDAKIS